MAGHKTREARKWRANNPRKAIATTLAIALAACVTASGALPGFARAADPGFAAAAAAAAVAAPSAAASALLGGAAAKVEEQPTGAATSYAASAAAAATTSAAAGPSAVSSAAAGPLLDMGSAVAIHIGSSVARKTASGAVSDISDADPLLTAYLNNNVTFVPISFLKDHFGVTSDINEKSGLLRLFDSGGKRIASYKSSQYDVAANNDGVIESYVPLRAVVEKLGKAIQYDSGLIIVADPAKPGADAGEGGGGDGGGGDGGGGAGDGALGRAELEALRLSLLGMRPVGNAQRLEKLLSRGAGEVNFLGSHSDYKAWQRRQELMYKKYYDKLRDEDDFNLGDADEAMPIMAEQSAADSSSRAMNATAAAPAEPAAPAPALAEAPEPQAQLGGLAGGGGAGAGAGSDAGGGAPMEGARIASFTQSMDGSGSMPAPMPQPTSANNIPPPGFGEQDEEQAEQGYEGAGYGGEGVGEIEGEGEGEDVGFGGVGDGEGEAVGEGVGEVEGEGEGEDGPSDDPDADDDEFSKTNTQVEGVEESDVVKTDGTYIYYVNGSRILIVEAYPPEAMRVVGRIDYQASGAASESLARRAPVPGGIQYDMGEQAGAGFNPLEIYVDGDKLVVIGSSDREAPQPQTIASSGGGASGSASARPMPVEGGIDEILERPEIAVEATTEVATTSQSVEAVTTSPTAAPVATTASSAVAVPATEPSLRIERAIEERAVDDIMPAPMPEPDIDYGYAPYPYYEPRQQTTLMLAYDISDRANPTLVRETEVDGYYKTSRKIGGSVYIVTNKYEYYYGEIELAKPPVAYRDNANANENANANANAAGAEGAEGAAGGPTATIARLADSGDYKDVGYGSIYYFPGQRRSNYIVIAGIDINDASRPASVQAVLDSGDNVYASQDCLYVASANYSYMDIVMDMSQSADRSAPSQSYGSTAIHRFRLSGASVSYDGRGEVPGHILNQFSMDQYGEWFRIATTTEGYNDLLGYFKNNNLYVLDSGLKIAGRLENLAPGERIYSVRFMGVRAYVVTFKTVDPLFVIDLADPRAPRVLGELKIPGYSDYLHPYDENHLIGVGKDAVEVPVNWGGGSETVAYYQGIKIALFDVSDVSNPIERWNTSIGDRGTESELLRNHKALLFSKERNLLALPVEVMEFGPGGAAGREAWEYGEFTFQGAYIYNLDLDTGFTLRGRITHLSESDLRDANQYGYYGWGSEREKYIDRLLYVRDTLYALSRRYISASDLGTLREIGRIDLN